MPDHYETPRDWRGLAMAAVWIAAAVVTLAGRTLARILTARRPAWQPLALAFAVGAGVMAVRGQHVSDGDTFGPSRVEAASEPCNSEATPHDCMDADARYTSADVMATAAAVVALNAPSGAAQDDPMVALVPDAAGPGGPVLPEVNAPDDGSPPSWLSRELSPYWGAIAAAAHERGIDSHWLGIVAMVENPQALVDTVTFDGGHGLAQIQRGTAAIIQAESGLPCVEGWMDPTTSYRCGAWYFRGAIDDGADLVRPGDDEPALLMGVAGYNSGHGSAIVQRLRGALEAGAADPCAWIGNEYTSRYCYSARDMWAQTLATRGVAPGAPDHLEVSR